MDLVAIEGALKSADPGVVLVEPRVLKRVVKRHRRLSGIGHVPHAHCYAISRAALGDIVTPGELGRASLPDEVIFVARPERLAHGATDAELLTPFWRLVFHARVHRELERRGAAGTITRATVRARIHAVGQTEFDEARVVLRQDDLLIAPGDEVETYLEFVATYLELARFAPLELARVFPTLHDRARVEAAIAQDVDADAILAAARPPGAVLPAPPAESAAHESGFHPAVRLSGPQRVVEPEPYRDVFPSTSIARARGNLVRAALTTVARTDAFTQVGRAAAKREAIGDLDRLLERLHVALGGGSALPGGGETLFPLVEAAVLGARPAERLLYDLQRACVHHEREVRTVGVAEWAVSLGARPLVRSLPAGREVRVAKEIHGAAAKLGKLALPEKVRGPIRDLVREAALRAEDRVRERLRPEIIATLDEVGLSARTLPERVARGKLVEELLDQIVARGFVTMGQLRDAIARNQLKLPDVDARQVIGSDALLAADRRLSRSLDGVYRRGEIYLRALQKLSSIAFGTKTGRFLTLFAILPLLASFLILEGLAHIVGPLSKHLTGHHVHLYSRPALAGGTVFFFALLHSPPFRRALAAGARGVGAAISFVLIGAPRWIWRRPIVQRVVASTPFALFWSYLARPLAPAAILYAVLRAWVDRDTALVALGVGFIGFNVIGNSRAGRTAEEIAADWVVRSGRHLGKRVLPGLFRLIVGFFHTLIELIDRFIYAVDEWLRYRQGEGRGKLWVKGTLGTIWFFLAYFLRLYVNLMLEPTINPVKHFPVVTVSAKILLPFSPTLLPIFRAPLLPFGRVVANTLAGLTLFLLPGVAGFLAWELKENWKLYRANRPASLGAIAIGHHGETLAGLMTPGFHSGTVPKLYTRLRRAAAGGKGAAKHHEALHHVAEAIRRFVERDLVAELAMCDAWGGGLVGVGVVDIGSNRIAVELVRGGASVWIHFDEQSGWILASIQEGLRPQASGLSWIEGLSDNDRKVFETALAGLYKAGAVSLVREQIDAALGAGASYDVAREGLVVWPDASYRTEIVYPLEGYRFDRQPIAWTRWIAAWEARPVERVVDASLLTERARVS
jgi:hypothetical protein